MGEKNRDENQENTEDFNRPDPHILDKFTAAEFSEWLRQYNKDRRDQIGNDKTGEYKSSKD